MIFLMHMFTAPSLSDIVLPNRTVPAEQIKPTSITADLPSTDQPFRYLQSIGSCLVC